MRTCLRLNPEHCGEKLTTNRLSQGTAIYKEILKASFKAPSLRQFSCYYL
jgi:hypothetical protein